jgi:hypothetical protein
VRTSLPVATSHSLIVLSSEPEARSRPSGLNATELTSPSVAEEGAHFSSCGHLPELDRLVIGAGGEELPVGTERHGIDTPGVAFEGAHFLSCGHIPQLDRIGAGGEEPPVGAERHGQDIVGGASEGAEGAHFLSCGHIPEDDVFKGA